MLRKELDPTAGLGWRVEQSVNDLVPVGGHRIVEQCGRHGAVSSHWKPPARYEPAAIDT
jgi:hypothetical protein